MSEARFQIVVNGKLTEGVSEDQAKQNMATLFKAPLEKLEPMFSGRKLAIKKGLTQEAALKYKAAINKAGMLAAIAPMDAPPPAATTPATTGLSEASLAPVGSIVDDSPPAAAPEINTEGLAMGITGIDLDDSLPPTTPDIDTSSLSVGAAGEDVSERKVIPEPDIDISALSAAEVGADVTDAVITPEANIDTSTLSMAAAGEDVTEHTEVAPADIDTSALSLDQQDK